MGRKASGPRVPQTAAVRSIDRQPSQFFSTKVQVKLVALSLGIPQDAIEEMMDAACAMLKTPSEGSLADRASSLYDALYSTEPCTNPAPAGPKPTPSSDALQGSDATQAHPYPNYWQPSNKTPPSSRPTL